MAGYSSMSDAELKAAYAAEQRGGTSDTSDFSAMTDDQLKAAYKAEQNGTGLTVDNAVRSIAHGVPVIGGLADKFAAGADAATGPLVDALASRFGFKNNASGTSAADTFGGRYSENLAREQAQSGAYAHQHPIANTAGELTGGVAGGAAVLPVAPLLSPASIASSAALAGADTFTRTGGDMQQALASGALGAAVPAVLGVVGRAAPWLLSLTSGVSPEAQALARQAGREGGEAGATFWRNMTNPDRAALVEMLDHGIDRLQAAGQAEYRAGMGRVGTDATQLSYQPVAQALQNARASLVHAPTGFVKDQQALNVVDQMGALVAHHAALPGQTADVMSFDALKQGLGAIYQRQPFGSNERRVAGNVYNAVKSTITEQAPGYAAVMNRYSAMKDQTAEIRAALGNSNRSSADTVIGKLLSTMRNDVSSRYGARADALQQVAQHAPNLPYALAGQTANAVLPRGIVARGLAAAKMDHGIGSLANVATIPFSSPRVVGAGNYAAGVAGRYAPSALPVLNAAQNTLMGGNQQSGAQPIMWLHGQAILPNR